ncbi:DUF262 domain-containing protein [Sansalvadorimonas sp. 2012CJ34-2]|uniref:DUF262 domain-containing protein n=1 Tax=Parendozoicomonas callyspongiae TaxID=2942213 RepID=A0ABT0PCT6_9GAMM|nr:DUF262 domain-containing protein [Sansalvadorimonas sp. 2012CJ34-2]MCL6269194.1 DUF262 domain-containing protein [Sansalvadorimonas sp. 2012CJ34-2]
MSINQDEENTIELEEEQFESEGVENDSNPDDQMQPFNPSKIDIAVSPVSMDSLIERMEHGEIELNTDFQRRADLWSPNKMSRLIESILIRLPLPAFYFDASDEDKWLVVDGLQRLSAIRKFVLDKERPLRLHGLEFLSKELKGKTYDELPRVYKRRLKECQVTTYQIRPTTPTEVKYSIFQRINTGGLTLNNQEIRHAMAKPRERDFLKKCAENQHLIMTMGDQSRRMSDQEHVLRFFAFFQHDFQTSKKNITAFLDDMLEEIKQKTDAELVGLKGLFDTAIERCNRLLDDDVFLKILDGSQKQKRKSSTLFEVWSVCLGRCKPEEFARLESNKDVIKARNRELLKEDIEFFNAITYSTQKLENVKIRHERVKNLLNQVLRETSDA